MDEKTLLMLFDVVTFRRVLAYLPAAGEPLGVLGALMLNQAIVWQGKGEGWVKKSVTEWQRETAMTRAEIREARRRLRATPFWAERETESALELLVRVDLEALEAALENLTFDEERG